MRFSKSKLILIEGLPGSGKSTTAQFLAYQMEKNNMKARWFHEYDSRNPLFYEDVIKEESLFNGDEFIKILLGKWKQLVDELQSSNEIYIIDGYLMQSTAGYMFENNIDKGKILSFSKEVIKIIEPLNPILIYMASKDVSIAINRLKILRGEEWVKEHVKRDVNLPYIVANNLTGFEGWVRMFSDLKGMTDEMYQLFNGEKIAIDYTNDEWETYHRKILNFLSLEMYPQMVLPTSILQRFVGNYRFSNGSHIIQIRLLDNTLTLYDLFSYTVKLSPIEKNKFVAVSTPHVCYFEENSKGVIEKMILDSRAVYQGEIYNYMKI